MTRKFDFQKLFLKQEEEEDEDFVSLVDALAAMTEKWPEGFHATDVAELINGSVNQDAFALREFLYPGMPQSFVAGARSVGKRLAAHIDEPVKSGESILILRKMEETTDRKMKGALKYHIHMDPPAAQQATPKATKQSAGVGKKRNQVMIETRVAATLNRLPPL